MRTTRRIVSCSIAAFGAGLLVATVCPYQLLLMIAAAALILCGCLRIKS